MEDISRYLENNIIKDLQKKMVFVGGPRQCGKTTLSNLVLDNFPYKSEKSGLYLNWDFDEHRKRILNQTWGDDEQLLIFDELHKYHRWKNWLKGLYDVTKSQHSFLVTGSARLDIYKKGGDSLIGRYHYWRLHPFTLFEKIKGISEKEMFKRLMSVGGFPEPFLDNDHNEAKRWRRERFDRIIRDDIRDLESIQNLQALSLFAESLRGRIGGMVVLANIAEDLQVAQKTLKRWLESLEKMYFFFSIRPLTTNVPRAIQKPPKVYLFDNADVDGDEGAKFENLIANHLLREIHYLEDKTGDRFTLHYIRDKQGREIDFALTKNNNLHALIEVKWSDSEISPSLTYFSERLKPRVSIQIVANLKRSYSKGRTKVRSPLEGLKEIFKDLV